MADATQRPEDDEDPVARAAPGARCATTPAPPSPQAPPGAPRGAPGSSPSPRCSPPPWRSPGRRAARACRPHSPRPRWPRRRRSCGSSQKIAAEPEPKGDATLVIRSQHFPDGKSLPGPRPLPRRRPLLLRRDQGRAEGRRAQTAATTSRSVTAAIAGLAATWRVTPADARRKMRPRRSAPSARERPKVDRRGRSRTTTSGSARWTRCWPAPAARTCARA